jgi:hypothetical protein
LAAVGHGVLMLLEGDVCHLCNNPMKITYPHNAVLRRTRQVGVKVCG